MLHNNCRHKCWGFPNKILTFFHLLVQAAAIHLEKVARREIGVFTSPKAKTRSKPLTPPPSGREPEASYEREPISYSILDSVGHCFEVTRKTFKWKLYWKFVQRSPKNVSSLPSSMCCYVWRENRLKLTLM